MRTHISEHSCLLLCYPLKLNNSSRYTIFQNLVVFSVEHKISLLDTNLLSTANINFLGFADQRKEAAILCFIDVFCRTKQNVHVSLFNIVKSVPNCWQRSPFWTH